MSIFDDLLGNKPLTTPPTFNTPQEANPLENPMERTLEYKTEKHTPCVIMLDCSDSMNGSGNIHKLNTALVSFIHTMQNLGHGTKKRIDVALIAYGGGGVRVMQNFIPADRLTAYTLEASGTTPMGDALNRALDLVEQQKKLYKDAGGVDYYRPLLYNITDGWPTDDTEDATNRLRTMEQQKKVNAYCIGVDGFDAEKMKKIFQPNKVLHLAEADFEGLFQFLSNSLVTLTNSNGNTGDVQPLQVEAPHTLTMVM